MSRSTSTKTRTAKDVAKQHAELVEAKSTATAHTPVIDKIAPQKKKTSKKRPSPISKKVKLTKLLCRSRGASMGELEKALGWQVHSIRAAISGLRKSGNTIERTPTKSGTRYHISGVAKGPGPASA